ncbi:transglycosylase SLT domain-containing protein [Streptomyces vinaceus]|uniref:transglycosylase SLT domain-containing protein n=1 Tax=Streptomyces vinaceus TaxID=1960 RepID=UPI0035D7F963
MFRTTVRPSASMKSIAATLVGLSALGGVLAATPAQAAPVAHPAVVRERAAVPQTPAASHRAAHTREAAPAAGGLHAWIDQALVVMHHHRIPGSYSDIKRNILRESSGNRAAVNETDANAAAGTPSKGLLQIIDPTFDTYHVAGTSTNPFDPVANIVAACNYAAHRYGSIDNVDSAY